VQSRVKKLEKIERVEPPRRRQTVLFDFPPAPRSGEDVVTLSHVHKGYGAKRIYDGLDFQLRRRERWCVMGVNGAGKSTLLKLVAGAAKPDEGEVALGASVKMGYFAQHAMELLDGDRTVFQSLEDSFPQAGQGALRTLAGCFGFSGDDVEKKCRVLSGGEKARLVMAKMLYDPPNFLVLDEPTNHLDIATKEMLIQALSSFEGAMLFVSHDRRFLAALSNRVLELTPEGVHKYDGGYTEYVARTGQEAPGLRGWGGPAVRSRTVPQIGGLFRSDVAAPSIFSLPLPLLTRPETDPRTSALSAYDFAAQRLFVEDALAVGAGVTPTAAAQNYLLNVLRLRQDEAILLFNGRDGEWRATVDIVSKRAAALRVERRLREQTAPGHVHYAFAPLKQARLD